MTEPFRTVQQGYDRLGVRYREWSRHSPVRLHWVDRLLAELAPDSLVVDLGCGAGEPATRIIAQHHRVIGVDGSATQLALGRNAAPGALYVQADMARFALRPGSVDAVASFYALGHLPAARHAPLFAAVAQWLRPGGVLLTSAPLGAGDAVAADWLGVPMFFGGIGEQPTRDALEQAGLHVKTLQVLEEDEGDGRTVAFLWVVARTSVEGGLP